MVFETPKIIFFEEAFFDFNHALNPSPADGFVNIGMQGVSCPGTVASLFDTRGCLVRTVILGEGMTTVSLEGLPPGLYFVRVACGSKPMTGAFVLAVP